MQQLGRQQGRQQVGWQQLDTQQVGRQQLGLQQLDTQQVGLQQLGLQQLDTQQLGWQQPWPQPSSEQTEPQQELTMVSRWRFWFSPPHDFRGAPHGAGIHSK
ncbi:hypothetical protein STEG23_015111 [Scotinomys teguina]